MVNNPRGRCLIINNQTFKHPNLLPERNGSQVDVDKLEVVFSTLGFQVKILANLEKTVMENELKLFARQNDHTDMSIVIVLSHGEYGQIFCQDYFEALNHKSGEVSIFIFQLMSMEKYNMIYLDFCGMDTGSIQ